jgi:hypothetical protein
VVGGGGGGHVGVDDVLQHTVTVQNGTPNVSPILKQQQKHNNNNNNNNNNNDNNNDTTKTKALYKINNKTHKRIDTNLGNSAFGARHSTVRTDDVFFGAKGTVKVDELLLRVGTLAGGCL